MSHEATTETNLETTDAPFINARDLAKALCISRMSLHRWRRAGYVPQPSYMAGNITLWAVEDIRKWQRDGCPWSDISVARRVRASMGAAAFNQMIRPETDLQAADHPEAAELARLADETENILNEAASRRPNDSGFLELHNRALALRAAFNKRRS